jgi:hypothetical protein
MTHLLLKKSSSYVVHVMRKATVSIRMRMIQSSRSLHITEKGAATFTFIYKNVVELLR